MTSRLQIPAREPFRFAPALRFARTNPPPGGSTIVAGERILHAYADGIGLEIAAGDEVSGGIDCAVLTDLPATPDLQRGIARYVDNFLSLSDDLAGFYALARQDKRFAAGVLERSYGYHQVKFPTPLQSAVWAVLSQATPQTLARKLTASLAQRYGSLVTVAGVDLTAFPDAAALLAVPKGDLRDLIASERKARTILAAAQAFHGADENWLRTAPVEFVEVWLREIPGIGAWSAAMILIRGLGRMESITVDSIASIEPILTAAKRVYGGRFDSLRLARAIERYGPYAGYWLHYLRAGVGR